MLRSVTQLFVFSAVLFASFSAMSQDVNSGLIFNEGWKFGRVDNYYRIDDNTEIWHTILDGNVLNAILFTRNEETKIWTPEKLMMTHYDVYSNSRVAYARYKNNLVRFRIEKNKKVGYEYFMDKLVNQAFEKSQTPFHTEPIEGELPRIDDVILTDKINLILANRNVDYSVSDLKVKTFDLDDLKLIEDLNLALESDGKVYGTQAICNNNKLGFVYFSADRLMNLAMVKGDDLQRYSIQTEKDKRILNWHFPRYSEGPLRITIMEDQTNPTFSIYSFEKTTTGDLNVLDQHTMTWNEVFRDYETKVEDGTKIFVDAMKQRIYEYTNLVTDDKSQYMVFVANVSLSGSSIPGQQKYDSKWGNDHGDLMIVKIENDKVAWMQTVRRSFRTTASKENNYLPIVKLEGEELVIQSRDNRANFDEQGNFISGKPRQRIQKLVDTQVVIDANSGNVVSYKVVN